MYLSHFGLRAQPFRTSPDVDAYYPATTHEAAIADLSRALEDEEGLLLLQGGPGTGKTLVAHRLIEGMPAGTRTVFLTHGSFRERTELLQAILFDLGLPYQEMSEQELRLSLVETCLERFSERGRTVVIIDEAHLLPAELLEELRLLSNLEGKNGKAVQVLLIGLPSIADTIEAPGLEIFRQRLAVCCRLEPLSIEESADYLLHQIRRSGGSPDRLLGEDVIDILSHASLGIPRILNQAAHMAFTLAFGAGSRVVDAEAAVEAVTRLGLDDGAEEVKVAETSVEELPFAEQAAAPLPSLQTSIAQAPSTPAPPVSVRMTREQGPPVYVYGGGPDVNDRLSEGKGQRVWQSAPQRAG
jgi:type II secretory pathway predicted ATPase ExeA